MNLNGKTRRNRRASGAYTLIELAVVIAIMVALAGITLTVLSGVDKNKARKLVAAQMAQLETALNRYHAKIGYYPSWSTNRNPAVNPLYYELVGTLRPNATTFMPVDKRWPITQTTVNSAFGFDRFVNAGEVGQTSLSLNPKDPDAVLIANYLPTLRDLQVKTNELGVALLGVPVRGPNGHFCAWNYWSPGVQHPESFDLWVEVSIDNKTVTIGNWKRSE